MNEKKRLSGPEARERIIQAAARAFRVHGLATTVEQIAAEASYTTSALYKHFANRDAVLEALGARLHVQILALYEDLPEVGFEKKLRALIARFVTFADREPDLLAAVLSTAPRVRLNPNSPDFARHRLHVNALADLMAQGQAEGGLTKTVSPDGLAVMLRAMLDAVASRWVDQPDQSLQPFMDEALEVFLHGAGLP